jgi:xylulokinase
LMTPGDYWLACGTAWVINGITETPDMGGLPPDMALNYHVIPERWISSLFLGGLGAGMEWWLEQVWQTPSPTAPLRRAESYQSFNAALDRTSPGSSGLLFYPVSGTPRSDAASGGYLGLRLDHTRADMGRAVMESAAYELRWALEELQKCSLQVHKLWMVGGATRNPVWPQILADVTGIPIWTTQYSHGPALGAAILAANGLGLMDGYPNWVVGEEIAPDPTQAPIYHASYHDYCGSMRES